MKSDNLKRIILYVFASTGAVLFFLAFFYMFKENKIISAMTILQIICANLIITIGLFLTHKIEFRFAILEYMLDIVFMMAVIAASGILFNWYSRIPAWVPVIIVIVIYILFNLLDIVRVHKDIKEINKLLQELKEKEADTVS
jgi:DNA integrity scanning protein DisA with diadenylate cyclase activity